MYEPLIPLTQAWAQVVVGPVETGGGDGSAAGLAAGVRGAVPRRRGLRPLAVREALARRVPLPRLRARQGLGAGSRHGLVECASCRRQASVTAGTVLHRSRLPLKLWFLAAWLVATHRNGMSARQLWLQLGVGSYVSVVLGAPCRAADEAAGGPALASRPLRRPWDRSRSDLEELPAHRPIRELRGMYVDVEAGRRGVETPEHGRADRHAGGRGAGVAGGRRREGYHDRPVPAGGALVDVRRRRLVEAVDQGRDANPV